ncbi:MAG: potassium channel family protein [Solirubrobacterales bacterium]
MQRRQGRGSLTARRAALIIVLSTVLVTVVGGVVVWLLDPDDFGSLGEAMWWAVQTVTTVGYGDVVPENTLGRVIGAVVMLNGIAFISLITASVTAILVEQARRRQQGAEEPVGSKLDQISARLDVIEARLEGSGPSNDPSARRS